MSDKIGGQRQRPRVALLGDFTAEDLTVFKRIFPTIWSAPDMYELHQLVDKREIDLLIVSQGVTDLSDWPATTHVICFSTNIKSLPGPVETTYLSSARFAETETYIFCEVSPPLHICREISHAGLTNVRGWPRLFLHFPNPVVETVKGDFAKAVFLGGAIIQEYSTGAVLAVSFIREDVKLGVAWLPKVDSHIYAWVEALASHWAQIDPDRFSDFGDWQKFPEWMVPAEERILSKIQVLEEKKIRFVSTIDKQIERLTEDYNAAKIDANVHQRRLITAQGDDLVDEVSNVFQTLGFHIINMDSQLNNNQAKREDLRLVHSHKGGEKWAAIVEVRGYARRGGMTSDLMRLGRFADLFRKETGHLPDKRIYIVNSQLELPPSQRQIPLAGAVEDLEVFSESDGILIWSLDLFRAMKAAAPEDYPALLESIKNAQGRWLPPK